MLDFTGKVAVVTGSAGGIGRATAISFAKLGAKVALADVDVAGIEQTAALIAAEGGESICIQTDVSQEKDCENMVQKTVEAFERIDVLFNNAGIAGYRAKTANMPTDEWQKVIDINLNGVFFGCKTALPVIEKNGGVIINTASVDGLIGMGSICHYTAAKHGVMGLTKSVALEYAKKNIRCLAIAPGYIVTDMTKDAFVEAEKQALNTMVPLGRGATAQEVANFVVWAASEQASYITGSFHQIDGGILAGFDFSAE